MKRLLTVVGFLLLAVTAGDRRVAAQSETPPLANLDLRLPGATAGWVALQHVRAVEASPEGLVIRIAGNDPYIRSPAIDLPEGVPLLATIRIKSDEAGALQLFYMRPGEAPAEERSKRKPVSGGEWRDVTLHVPPLGPGTTLRLDPPGADGVCVVESIQFRPQVVLEPQWSAPGVPKPTADAPTVTSGTLALRQDPSRFGGFTLHVGGREVATGHDRPTIAYATVVDGQPVVRWLDVAEHGGAVAVENGPDGALRVRTDVRDQDGGTWRLDQTFRPHAPGVIAFDATVSVDAPRSVYFAPFLLVLPGNGQGAFGASKGQAILAGVEYLENEPSSSTADLGEMDAVRRTPSEYQLTFPLMAVQARGTYLGVIWDRGPTVAPLFDSPDRTLGGNGHLLGLIAPGADGTDRIEGTIFPDAPSVLPPGSPLKASGLLIGGEGGTIIPAVQKYVELKGLPPIPDTPGLQDYVRTAATGWLDSPIRDGARYRHATAAGDFQPTPAADAAWMMNQLAGLTDDAKLAARLREAATEAAAAVPPQALLHSAIGHNIYAVAPLVLAPESGAGDAVVSHLSRAVAAVASNLQKFEPDGSRRYRAVPGRLDYGSTHFSEEADGYAGQAVDQMLRYAAFSGDQTAVDEALRLLYILRDRFRDGVPRGAQTWEIALHTPDVLASAYLVRAFCLGYELTGDATLLDAAKYWAWTGVPFVYLVNPTESAEGPGGVGPYATIPVLGSTNWVAPNWIGLPVQWCGLVYADALIELARYDDDDIWTRLADGIAASGVLQTYPIGQKSQGLLPDSFTLLTQGRNPADINPGTLQPIALRLYGGASTRPYQVRVLRNSGLRICAPGAVDVESDAPGEAVFVVHAWNAGGSSVVVHGVLDAGQTQSVPEASARTPNSLVIPLPGAGAQRITVRTTN